MRASDDLGITWLDLELRHLATFRTLANELSFRATAARLGFAQSAISQHIATLERRVGARLVDRGHGVRAIKLTPAGELLLEHADAILSRVALAERDFAHRERESGAAVRLGTFPSVAARLLAPALAAARKLDATLLVELVEAARPLDLLRDGQVDLAFSETPPRSADVAHVELLDDPYELVVPFADPRPQGHVVSAEALAAAPLLTYQSSCHLEMLERELATTGVRLRPAIRHDDALTLQMLVAEGLGVALLPRLALTGDDERTRSLPVEPRLRARTICLAWSTEREPSGGMRTLVSAIERRAAQLRAETAPGRASTALRSLAARPSR